ncbi:hypothetical protein E8E14_005451 [Neopestalotiopsis sp. 37M]|nr:hypothetical protein E8E14_005451 [Neopestalotiopsis sp. 37M]
MTDGHEQFELSEMDPRIQDSPTQHDASDVQESTVDAQQSDADSLEASTTQVPVDDKPSDGASETSRLWQRAVAFGKNTTAGDILTFCSFPLLVLGAWAAIQTIRMAQWTQWKDVFEWCENHDWTYAGCSSLRDTHLNIPSAPPAMKRSVTVPSIEWFDDTFLTGPGMPAINILGSTLYLLVVILFDVIRRFSKSRKESRSISIGSSGHKNTKGWAIPFSSSTLDSLREELETVRAEAARAAEEQSELRAQLVAINAQTAASLAELNGRLVTLKSETKKNFAEVRTETKDVKEMALSGFNDTRKIGVSTALVNDNSQAIQCDERSESHIHNKGVRKRLSDIREREHSGLLW